MDQQQASERPAQAGQETINEWVRTVVDDNWLSNLSAVNKWREIAAMVGPEKTRDELIRMLEGSPG